MRTIALLLVIALWPGAAEAAEDLSHLMAEGHTLHAAQAPHEDHDEKERHGGDEHGCSVLFHLCGCHSPAPSMVTMRVALWRDELLDSFPRNRALDHARHPSDGVDGEAFRPPIA